MRTANLAALLVMVAACSRGSGAGANAIATSTSTSTSTPTSTPTPTPTSAAGPRAEGAFWTASLEAPKRFRAGEPAAARVQLIARGGYHVNLDYPLAFIPAADATADFASARVALSPSERTPCDGHPGDVCTVGADVPLVPRGGSALRVAGTLAFSVCTAERCLIEKAPLAVTAP